MQGASGIQGAASAGARSAGGAGGARAPTLLALELFCLVHPPAHALQPSFQPAPAPQPPPDFRHRCVWLGRKEERGRPRGDGRRHAGAAHEDVAAVVVLVGGQNVDAGGSDVHPCCSIVGEVRARVVQVDVGGSHCRRQVEEGVWLGRVPLG